MAKLTLSFKGRPLRVCHLERGITIGRGDDCELQIDSLAVLPHHARVRLEGNSVMLDRLDPDGPLAVNHKPIDSVQLEHGDIIQIGKHVLSFSSDGLAISPAREEALVAAHRPGDDLIGGEPDGPVACLQMMSGQYLGRILRLSKPVTQIGQGGEHRAMIAHREQGYFLSHLDGERTPRIDGRSIGDSTVCLQDGNLLTIGDTEMQFFLEP